MKAKVTVRMIDAYEWYAQEIDLSGWGPPQTTTPNCKPQTELHTAGSYQFSTRGYDADGFNLR